MPETQTKLNISKEMTPLEYHMLKKLGLSEEQMHIVHDLARHAAEKASESVFIVAMTAPEIDMINLVSVTACMLLGHTAQQVANKDAKELARLLMPPGHPLREYDGSFSATRDFGHQS
jgi:hypothetical protein